VVFLFSIQCTLCLAYVSIFLFIFFTNVCFAKCICCVASLVCCQIHFGLFIYLFFAQCLLLQWKKLNNDLDFEIKYVVFETKVINRYGNYSHNHFEDEIISYRNAWTTFTKMSKTLESKRGLKINDMYVVL